MRSRLEGWLGGSPGSVLLKLAFLSLAVGAVMAGVGLSPALLLDEAIYAFRSVFGYGFEAVRNIGRYMLTGAVLVVPIWIVGRLLRGRS